MWKASVRLDVIHVQHRGGVPSEEREAAAEAGGEGEG
jgi:hypothetical protein